MQLLHQSLLKIIFFKTVIYRENCSNTKMPNIFYFSKNNNSNSLLFLHYLKLIWPFQSFYVLKMYSICLRYIVFSSVLNLKNDRRKIFNHLYYDLKFGNSIIIGTQPITGLDFMVTIIKLESKIF